MDDQNVNVIRIDRRYSKRELPQVGHRQDSAGKNDTRV